MVAPCRAGDLRGGQAGELAFDLGGNLAAEPRRGGDQGGRRRGAVLGLPQQIGHHHLGIGRLVGDNQDLRRPGQQIDADAAEELPLGLGHIGVARPDQHIDARDGLGAQRHRRHRLDAADDIDLVGATQRHRRDGLGMGRPAGRWRAGNDVPDAGHPGRDDAHMRRGHHGIAPARHVAPDAVDRNVPVPQCHARQGLHLHVPDRLALNLREVADLRLSEADVCDGLVGDRFHQPVDLGLGQPEALGRPAVEPLGQLAHRRVAARLHVGQDTLDRLAHPRVGRLRFRLAHARLENLRHGRTLSRPARRCPT